MRHLLIATAAAALSLSLSAPAIAQDSGVKQTARQIAGKAAEAVQDEAAEYMKKAPTSSQAALLVAANADSRAEDRARDSYRHPVETLEFFQVGPQMKVGEYAPGGGWYSRMLGEYLGDEGELVGLYFSADAGPFNEERQQRMREAATQFPTQVSEWTGKPAARFGGMSLDAVPEGEAGTFDRVLLVRMLHNLHRWNSADSELKAMRALLKDGGMLGVVQHRASTDTPTSYADGNKGYLRQEDVIKLVEAQGFELVSASEINANPKDTADHENGVWELPPVWRNKDDAKQAIGESDRMTLLFRKRP